MMVYGRGLTVCGFCEGMVRYVALGDHIVIVGREVKIPLTSPLPLFCSDECFAASSVRLDEMVNA